MAEGPATVRVGSPCGFLMESAVADLGQEALCPKCGVLFRLWPTHETSNKGPDSIWFLRIGATEFGPFPPGELVRFVAEGRIQKDSLVRRGESGPWTPAALVRGLLEAPAKRPPMQLTTRGRETRGASAMHVPHAAHGSRGGDQARSASGDRSRRRNSVQGQPRDWASQLARQPVVVLVLVIGIGAAGLAVFLVTRRHPDSGVSRSVAKASAAKPLPVVAAKAPLTPQQLVAKAGPSVAILQGRNGSGSGFLVEAGLLATNRHVIEGEIVDQIRVQWPDAGRQYQGSYSLTLVYEDPVIDLALLEIDVKLPPLALALDARPARGQEIMCIGSPGVGGGQMLNNAIGRGLLGTSTIIDGQTYLQLDLAVNPGNSGGPVFNMDGKVIGVVTLKAANLSGVGFCLPAESLKTCLDRAKALSSDERARIAAQHRLRLCASGLLRGAKTYAAAGSIYVKAMNQSLAAGENINVGLRKARVLVDEFLQRRQAELMFTIREQAERPPRDVALSALTRERYGVLLALFGELKDHVESPSGTLDSYAKKQKTHEQALRSIEAYFVTKEGVCSDDE